MTSTKKLSIGAAIALVAGLITGLPANAATQTLAVNSVTQNTGTTAATAIALPVPADNTVSVSNALSISVSGIANNTTVSATATNALLLSTLSAATVASGSATVAVNSGTGTSAEFFVFTKTAATGSVVVTVGNTTTTYYVVGTPGAVAKVVASAPATGLAGSTQSVVVSAFDKYDNAKGSGSVNLVINTNGVVTTTTVTTGANGTVSHVVTLPTSGSVTVTAFAASSSSTVNLAVTQPRNIEAELGVALAAVATLTADLATANTAKADLEKVIRKLKWQYNVLVKKYNVGKPKAQKLAFIK
jgi:adhesin/invasin